MSDALRALDPRESRSDAPTMQDYLRVTAALSAFGVGIAALVTSQAGATARSEALVAPLLCLLGLTALVWLTMVVVRNYAILRRITSGHYYRTYQHEHPPDWVERPARTFDNLMQVPQVFYALTLLMIVTGELDRAQVMLAWVFVALRALHAAIYIGWNYVPARFGAWIAGCVTLIVLGVRFALAWR